VADLDTLWRNRSDDQVSAALDCLDDYNEDAQAIIRAEQGRRGLPPPILRPTAGTDLSLVDVSIRDELPSTLAAPLTTVSMLALIVTVFAIPVASYRLFKRLGVSSGLALLTYAPLLGLLFVLGFRYVAADWAKRNRVAVSLSGPKPLHG